jgi:biotin carboxylase
MRKFMILGASNLQLPAIKQAKEMGLKVVAIDMDADAVGFNEPEVEKEVISTIDIPAVVEAARKHNVCGVVTVASDMPMRTVAAVAKELSLIGVSEETAVKATNKADMRLAFKENGVASPESYRVSTKAEFDEIAKKFNYFFIVKPADNSGSRGIYLVNSALEAEKAYEYSHKFSRGGDVVVEEFMTGPEVSVEILAVNGEYHVLQVTDKLTTGAPHFVEIGHSQPSRLPKNEVEAIKALAIQAAKAVGIENGPGHAEIILTKDGPKMVEIGARMGGGCITTHLVPLSTGINMTKATIQIALGETPDIQAKHQKGSAIRFIIPPTGRVDYIGGEKEAKNVLGVKEVEIQCKPGQEVGEFENGASRIGYVIAQAETPEAAIEICERALEKITITTK